MRSLLNIKKNIEMCSNARTTLSVSPPYFMRSTEA